MTTLTEKKAKCVREQTRIKDFIKTRVEQEWRWQGMVHGARWQGMGLEEQVIDREH